jgi:hypothetical protein
METMTNMRTFFAHYMRRLLVALRLKSIQSVDGGGLLGMGGTSQASAVSRQPTRTLPGWVILSGQECGCRTEGKGSSAVWFVCAKHWRDGSAFQHSSPILQTIPRPRTI